jgi:4-hydroxy-tetrahydrodipicolinate synthase
MAAVSDGRRVLAGVTVPVVTALTPDGDPDSVAARPHLEALAAAGITSVMFFGTNGEGALLNPHYSEEYLVELAPLWRELAGPDAVVTATAFGAGTRETLNRARLFEKAEPDAIVVAPPYYFVHTERELVAYYAALDVLEVPVVAYNAPRYTGNPLTPSLLARLAAMPHVVGLKDSGGDDELLLAALALAEEHPFAASQGNERRMSWALDEGADGVTPGLANLAPAECLALAAAVAEGRRADADVHQERLVRLIAVHARRGGVAAMKAALSLRGMSSLHVAPPLEPYSPEELEHVAAVLADWDGALIS